MHSSPKSDYMNGNVGGACSTYGEKRNKSGVFFAGKPEGKRLLGRLGIGGRIILISILIIRF